MEVPEILVDNREMLRKVFQNSLQKLLFKKFEESTGVLVDEQSQKQKRHFKETRPGKISTCAGTIEPGLPRDREVKFSANLFRHYPGSESALF